MVDSRAVQVRRSTRMCRFDPFQLDPRSMISGAMASESKSQRVSSGGDGASGRRLRLTIPSCKSHLGSGPPLSVSSDMAPIQCLGFLFDLDGVLVDSTPA